MCLNNRLLRNTVIVTKNQINSFIPTSNKKIPITTGFFFRGFLTFDVKHIRGCLSVIRSILVIRGRGEDPSNGSEIERKEKKPFDLSRNGRVTEQI